MEPASEEPLVAVHGSVAVELDWALFAAGRRGQATARPELAELYARDPDLADEVERLWGPDERLSYPGYPELSVAAHQAGLLFSMDGDELLDSLEELLSAGPESLTLASETPQDRARLLGRLRTLRRSPRRRKHYVATVSRVWSELQPAWEARGRLAVEQEVAVRRSQYERPGSWREFPSTECQTTTVEALVEALPPGGELAIVPAYFANCGLVFDLPGMVVVGVKAGGSDGDAARRAEQLARRLKSIADPTRLAILAALSRGDLTVTEIARRFGLAQPTVSNHIRILRDAGFVTGRSDGRSRRLGLEPGVVADIGKDLEGLLGTP